MQRLFPQKMVTVVTSDVLEQLLITKVKKCGASGYTIHRARGAGSSVEQSGMLDVDSNIRFQVILPEEHLSPLLDELERLIHQGHHLIVTVQDVSVLNPDKFKTRISD